MGENELGDAEFDYESHEYGLAGSMASEADFRYKAGMKMHYSETTYSLYSVATRVRLSVTPGVKGRHSHVHFFLNIAPRDNLSFLFFHRQCIVSRVNLCLCTCSTLIFLAAIDSDKLATPPSTPQRESTTRALASAKRERSIRLELLNKDAEGKLFTELIIYTNLNSDLMAVNNELQEAESAYATATERFEAQLTLTQENLSE